MDFCYFCGKLKMQVSIFLLDPYMEKSKKISVSERGREEQIFGVEFVFRCLWKNLFVFFIWVFLWEHFITICVCFSFTTFVRLLSWLICDLLHDHITVKICIQNDYLHNSVTQETSIFIFQGLWKIPVEQCHKRL